MNGMVRKVLACLRKINKRSVTTDQRNDMSGPTGALCAKKHGGDYHGPDAGWYCDECARKGINPCSCGSPARYFGEALMCSVHCENNKCGEFLTGVGNNLNIRERWNKGERGVIEDEDDLTRRSTMQQ